MAAEETAAASMVMAAAMATRQQSTKSILGWVAGRVAEWVAGWDLTSRSGKEYVHGTE